MDNKELFHQFSRQSKKGILIIYLSALYKSLKVLWIFLFFFLQKFSKISDSQLGLIYLGIACLLLFLFFRSLLIFKNFQFKIEDQHFILQRGILKKTNTSIPFDRIQNIKFKQNIVQQLINVFEVNIETAGSSKAEISIKALSFSDANALKQSLSSNTSRTSDIENISKQKPLLKISLSQLIKVSLTENHLQSFLLLLAILIGVYQQITELFGGMGERELMDFYIEETSFSGTNILVIIGLLVLFLVISVISSMVRVYFRHFNLTVFIQHNALEIDQGLTTKSSVILKKEKVQHITISDNPIKKKLGISFITFKQAISGKTKKKQDKIIKIIGCKKEQVGAIKKLLFPNEAFENPLKKLSDHYYKKRLYMFAGTFFLVLNVLLYVRFELHPLFWLNALVLPLLIGWIHLKYQKQYYFCTKDIIVIGSGSIETHHTYLPIFKVQNIKLKQSIFQAKYKVIDLVFQTAAGKISIPCLKEEDAYKIYNDTLFKVETSRQSWM